MDDAAVIAAYASLVVAIVSAIVTIGVARSQQKAQAELQQQKARLDYEYEARKRLYTEMEPLLFKLVETCDEAWHRILSLTRTARDNNLAAWLSPSNHDYYLYSTIYKLLAPLAVIRLLQEKMTLVDLSLEPRLRDQYYLAKTLDRFFTDDFSLARTDPQVPYDPFRRSNPDYRQGLPLGEVDIAAQALIVRPLDAAPRVVTFGEFYTAAHAQSRTAFAPFVYLFSSFEPGARPVLWRVLLAQAIVLRTFAGIRVLSRDEPFDPLRRLSAPELKLLEWNGVPGALDAPLAAAYRHVETTFAEVSGAAFRR